MRLHSGAADRPEDWVQTGMAETGKQMGGDVLTSGSTKTYVLLDHVDQAGSDLSFDPSHILRNMRRAFFRFRIKA
jgi:hypothetical protein